MASELTVTAAFNYVKNNVSVNRSHSITVDVTGDAFTYQIQEIGTVEEIVEQGADVGTPGYILMRNLDATNYIEIGSTTGVYDIKLQAGEVAIYRHNSATIYAKANTGACLLEYFLIEE